MNKPEPGAAHAIFTDDPATARDRFLRAAATVGMPVKAFAGQTANDPPITCDVGRLGSPDAPTAIVMASNAPGLAGFVGAGACTAILHDRLQHYLHTKTSLILVHAVNPAGPVWPPQSPDPPLPKSASGASTPPPIGDPAWTDQLLSAAEDRYNSYLAANSARKAEIAAADRRARGMTGRPGWSAETVRQIARTYLTEPEFVLFLDFRTGPEAWGEVAVHTTAPKASDNLVRAQRWFAASLADSAYADGACPVAGGFPAYLDGSANAMSVVVEIGTLSMSGFLEAEAARRQTAVAYPTGDDWRDRARRIIHKVMQEAMQGAAEMAESLEQAKRSKST